MPAIPSDGTGCVIFKYQRCDTTSTSEEEDLGKHPIECSSRRDPKTWRTFDSDADIVAAAALGPTDSEELSRGENLP